jgi:hypothetical protein
MWGAAPAQHFEPGGPSGRAGREGTSRLDHHDAHEGGLRLGVGVLQVTVRAKLREREPKRATGAMTASQRAEGPPSQSPTFVRGGMGQRVVGGPLHAGPDPDGERVATEEGRAVSVTPQAATAPAATRGETAVIAVDIPRPAA